MDDAPADPRIAAALARNDRYLREFVEAFNLCPFARRCRESGKLQRAVSLVEGGLPASAAGEAALAALEREIARFEAMPAAEVEVALILFPALTAALTLGQSGAQLFEQFVAEARKRMDARHASGGSTFYCVAFHPQFREDLTDAQRAVRFIRRSPDPTVQLVRASLLHELHRADAPEFVDTAGLSTAQLLAINLPLALSERIGQANLSTLKAAGADRLRELLDEIGAHARPPAD